MISVDDRPNGTSAEVSITGPDASTSCGLNMDSCNVELAAKIFGMLADPTRVRLILALHDNEMSVNNLALEVGKPRPAVSQHLAKMRLARLVSKRQEGTRVYYSLENGHARQLVTDAIFQAEHAAGGKLGHHTPRESGGV